MIIIDISSFIKELSSNTKVSNKSFEETKKDLEELYEIKEIDPKRDIEEENPFFNPDDILKNNKYIIKPKNREAYAKIGETL